MEGCFKEITKAVLKAITMVVVYTAVLVIPAVVSGVMSLHVSPWRFYVGAFGIPIIGFLFAPLIYIWVRKGYKVAVVFAVLTANNLLVQALGITGVLTLRLESLVDLALWIFLPPLVAGTCFACARQFYDQVKSGQVVGFDDVIGYPTRVKAEDVAVVCRYREYPIPPMPADASDDEPEEILPEDITALTDEEAEVLVHMDGISAIEINHSR